MIATTNEFNGQIDIHQRRVKLADPQNGKTRVLVNVIIYCSQYYPLTRHLADQVLDQVIQKSPENLLAALEHLYGCIERQTIVGPSSSFLPPSEIPQVSKLDGSFQHYDHNTADLEHETNEIVDKLGLSLLSPKNKTKQLLWYNCSSLLSMKSVQNNNHFYKHFSEQLQIDGQSWLESTPFPSLFVTLSYFLNTFNKINKLQRKQLRRLKLLRARLGQLHNKFLKNPVGKLAEIVLSSYKQVVELSTETTFQDYIELLLQYSYSLLFYYKYSQSEQLMRHCADLLHMKMEFTGRLGRRTKFQSFDTALLVMNLVQQNQHQQSTKIHDANQEEELHLIEAKKLVHRERQITHQGDKKENIMASTFDEENILLETPKFVQEQGEKKVGQMKQLSQIHLLSALGILYFEWRSTSRDEMLLQNIAASITTLLAYEIPTSFSYRFSLLLLRSLNQFSRIKNTERALDQLEKLKNSFNLKADKDASNVYATPYETRLGFVLILADRYMQIGLSISAVGLFEQAGLFQECVEGLIAKNFKERALETANRLIDNRGKSPRLLCMLGDIKGGKQPELYEEAWELSKHTCARAQRSLGWLYFNKGDFVNAQVSFNKATQASYYHPSTWFTLGCTRLRLNQFEGALRAFAESVSIDDSQGEAWGNMASCYMHLKKMKEAYSTLIQAVKFSERNWKLWANLLTVSLSNKQFYKYFECIERLAKLEHPQILTEEALAKIIQIMQFIGQKSEYKRAAYNCKNRLERLFEFLQEKIGGNPLVWRTKTAYLIELLEYYDILDVHYHNQHIEKKLNPNDIVPGYETIEQTALTTKTNVYHTKELIVEAKQNELNMAMRVGWNENKIESEKVKKILIEYVEIYRKYSLRNDKEEFKLFVSGVAQKVAAGMEIEFIVPLEWL